ncbi:MAG: hypothetical protein J6V56_07720 [Clostridia bacterium]|nr:hypothetical protein [Clostridia bacterium]
MKKKISAFLLGVLTLFTAFASSCEPETLPQESTPQESVGGVVTNPTYTYNDYLEEAPSTWSPFNWKTDEDKYILSLTQMGLYDFILDESGEGYEMVWEMAASDPVDVTEQYAKSGKWPIPADATSGYAYKIALNSAARWEDGTPINADTYLYSMQQLLDSGNKNYRASDYATGTLAVINGYEYYNNDKAGTPIYRDNLVDGEYVHPFDTREEGEDGVYTASGTPIVFVLDSALTGLNGYSIQGWYEESGKKDFASCIEGLRELADENGYVPVTDESIALLFSFTGSVHWGYEARKHLAAYVYYGDGEYTSVPWSKVGFLKTGEYEITLLLKNPVDPLLVKYNLTTNFIVKKDIYEQDKEAYASCAENYSSYGPYKLVTYAAGKVMVLERNEGWYGYSDGKHKDQFAATTVNCTVITDGALALGDLIAGKLDRVSLSPADMETYGDSRYILYTPQDFTSKLSFNGDIDALKKRETEGVNKSILAYKDFRKAISLAINREEFCISCTATHEAGYGLLNYMYVCNPETGALYRENAAAKDALCKFYGVNNVAEITGYDLAQAKELLESAYKSCLKDENISETDTVVLELSVARDDEANRNVVAFINTAVQNAAVGTPLEGRINIVLKADGNFYENCKRGLTDIIVSTWGGNAMDPFSIMECYCVNDKHYEYGFDGEKEFLTVTVAEEEITKTFTQWYIALSAGEYASADLQTRINILAALEQGILEQYFTTPLYYRVSASLNGRKTENATQTYVQNIGFGGMRYMKFVYNDEEWAAYVAESNNSFNY